MTLCGWKLIRLLGCWICIVRAKSPIGPLKDPTLPLKDKAGDKKHDVQLQLVRLLSRYFNMDLRSINIIRFL